MNPACGVWPATIGRRQIVAFAAPLGHVHLHPSGVADCSRKKELPPDASGGSLRDRATLIYSVSSMS